MVIYVERNVAKVRVKSSLTTLGEGLIKVTDKDGNDITVGSEQVYVKLNGWNVTGTLPNAYLSKHINSAWQTDYLGAGTQWNYYPYFRSYWADYCPNSGNNQYINLSDAAKMAVSNEEGTYIYCNENAERPGTNEKKPTQILIPATLCKADGTPLTISEYAGSRIVDNANFDGLKALLLETLKVSLGHSVYKKTSNPEKYTEIGTGDIEFKTASVAKPEFSFGDKGGYYVYACLTTDAKAAEWHNSNEAGNTDILSASDLSSYLLAQQHAKIWNGGRTYYYLDIKHIGNPNASLDQWKSGVVRNHIYDVNLTALYGIGTPVYDPSENIYPEKPQDDDTFIAAQIKILSWRVVANNVKLDWGD